MVEGATLRVLERPDIAPHITGADGAYCFDEVYVGEEVTIVARHPEFYPYHSSTIVPDEFGIADFSLQMPPRLIARALSLVLFENLRWDKCQIATTATRAGGNPWTPGIAGVTVSINPPIPSEHGPFYFKIFEIPGWPMLDLPIRSLNKTTGDGGAIFVNVPPGDYVLSAQKPGEQFTEAKVKCRAGELINASPPHGLQRLPL
jgi:hypothetical protein